MRVDQVLREPRQQQEPAWGGGWSKSRLRAAEASVLSADRADSSRGLHKPQLCAKCAPIVANSACTNRKTSLNPHPTAALLVRLPSYLNRQVGQTEHTHRRPAEFSPRDAGTGLPRIDG